MTKITQSHKLHVYGATGYIGNDVSKNENDNPNIETLLKVIEDEPNEQERKIMVYEKENEILLPNV